MWLMQKCNFTSFWCEWVIAMVSVGPVHACKQNYVYHWFGVPFPFHGATDIDTYACMSFIVIHEFSKITCHHADDAVWVNDMFALNLSW